MELSDSDLDRLEALLAKTSPKPWRHKPQNDGTQFMTFSDASGETVIGGCGCCTSPYGCSQDSGQTFYKPNDTDRANAELISSAPLVVSQLIAEVRRLRGLLYGQR